MNNFVIVSDSTCDLGADLREKYSIDYVKMAYIIDEVSYPASLDWESHSAHEFYDLMRNGKFARTVQITRETVLECFTKHLEAGNDIIYITCSSALSGSYNFGCLMAKELCEEYPDRKIYCIDSLNSTLGQGMLAIKAAILSHTCIVHNHLVDGAVD